MVGSRLLAALFLSTLVLAGCASKATTDSATDDAALKGVQVQATATTGVIRGIVVDTAVRPLGGVLVSLRVSPQKEMTTNTTAAGAFGFQGLAAGTYFLKASKPGYRDVQTSAEVRAGESTPAITRVSMDINPSTRPFVEAYVFKGFIECSTTTVAVSAALCALPNIAQPNVTRDNTQVHYQPQRVPTWVQSEMLWQSTQALGDELQLEYSWGCGQQNGGFLCDHGARGTSPLMISANATAIGQIGMGNSTDVYLRVFNTWNDATAPPPGTCTPDVPGVHGPACPRGIGATAEQDFTIYTHIFYGFSPPDGYRFSKDGEPQPPQ